MCYYCDTVSSLNYAATMFAVSRYLCYAIPFPSRAMSRLNTPFIYFCSRVMIIHKIFSYELHCVFRKKKGGAEIRNEYEENIIAVYAYIRISYLRARTGTHIHTKLYSIIRFREPASWPTLPNQINKEIN